MIVVPRVIWWNTLYFDIDLRSMWTAMVVLGYPMMMMQQKSGEQRPGFLNPGIY